MPHRPSSDLYSLGATLSYLVTGAPPPISQHRLDALSAGDPDPSLALHNGYPGFDPALLSSIDKALSVLPGVRYQSAPEWLDELEAEEPQSRPVPTRAIFTPDVEPMKVDADLENMLASLVENTNSGLVPAGPETSKERQAVPPPAPSEQPRQLVDIFGEPISNVDRWLKDQDRASSRKQPIMPGIANPEPSAPQDSQAPSRGFAKFIPFPLRRIFGDASSTRND